MVRLDGCACPVCDSTNTVETGPPERGVVEMLCAACGAIFLRVWV